MQEIKALGKRVGLPLQGKWELVRGIEVVQGAPEESSVEGGGNMVFKIVINWHCVL